MAISTSLTAKISNYKCFAGDEYGYDTILPVNLIIGRNNSGKSTLLDLIHFLTEPRDMEKQAHKGQTPRVTVSDIVTEEELRVAFQQNANGGDIIAGNHWEYGHQWIGHRMTWEIAHKGFNFISIDPPFEEKVANHFGELLATRKQNPFSNFAFKRLLADRDMNPESDGGMLVNANGGGATTVIQSFINKAWMPSALVKDTILGALNSIFEPDGSFTDIVVQQLESGQWEVYLEEAEKGSVPLSHTGSGLKTILLVLVFLHLIPQIENMALSRYLFGFEELENNLHPALQRRLLQYIRNTAIENDCTFFLTTHSSVAIDLFSRDDQAQILHVTHDRHCASVKRVTTYVDNSGILDDLDVRASDLLQANGIVWLEGPSDRLYFKKWVELCSDGKLQEGTHYQCVFYGGRLLSHLSATDPDVDADAVVKILRVNRNAILLVDSDKSRNADEINTTKQRILDEIGKFGGMAWLTEGKEIENYIPQQAIASLYTRSAIPSLKRYQNFANYLNTIKAKEGARFLRNKVLFAERMVSHITTDGIKQRLDLYSQVMKVCSLMRSWNRMD